MVKYDVKAKQPFYDFCRRAAADGAVLLRNEEQVLPVHDETVSVFGRMQFDWYRSGTGSGGAVNVARKTNLTDSLRKSGRVKVNEDLAEIYEKWIGEHPFDDGGFGWATEPWFQEEMPLTKELVSDAAEKSGKALFVIGRTAGEDQDNAAKAGSCLLTDMEKENLRLVTSAFDKVAVILNTSNIIDMAFIDDPAYQGHIQSVLYVWQGGQEGGAAAADVVTGAVNPSGKLTDTIAKNISMYPAYGNFGDEEANFYQEDIYVGYRYFETFAPDDVLFPFGFGLSYTTFRLDGLSAKVHSGACGNLADTIGVNVTVTNTGDEAGREVVQVYYNAPQGRLGKPLRQLVAFKKTGLLSPGESEEVEILFPVTRMASFDDSGVTGYRNAWVLEQGRYRIYVGTSVRNAEKTDIDGRDGYPVIGNELVEQLEEACAPERAFQRLRPDFDARKNSSKSGDATVNFTPENSGASNDALSGTENRVAETSDGIGEMDPETAEWMRSQIETTGIAGKSYEDVPLRTVDLKQRILSELPEEISQTGDCGYKLSDVKNNKVPLREFIAQLSDMELMTLVRGEGMCSPKVTPGTAGAFGGMSDSLAEKGIPAGCCSDGPSGIRQDDGTQATQMPIGTLLACTWDPELVQKLYTFEGEELREKEIDTLLGPGMNIHRHPLNGRNFEYFSEDPLLSGCFGAACLDGMRKSGADGTIKHFACNNQEQARRSSDSIVSQRALREIYLRGFELAVKEAGADSLMTSYNELNGHHCSSNYELVTTILRKEWGFRGQVMTDWFTTMNDVLGGEEQTVQDTASMVRSQNDLYMVVHNNGAEVNDQEDNLEEALAGGKLTRGELQRAAANILGFLLHSQCMDRKIRIGAEVLEIEPEDRLSAAAEIAEADANGNIYMPVNMVNGNIFHVPEDGIYEAAAVTSFKALPTAQSAARVMINGKDTPMVSASGDWYRPESRQKFARLCLKQGYYHLAYAVTKGGMKLLAFYLVRSE